MGEVIGALFWLVDSAVEKAETEAEDWGAMPLGERISGPMNFWIEGEKRSTITSQRKKK